MRIWQDIVIEDELLKRKGYDSHTRQQKNMIIIGKQLRQKVMEALHDTPDAGHLGVDKTWERCNKEMYWPGMYTEVRDYCKRCLVCQQVKFTPTRPPLHNVPIGKPWSTVGVDVLEVPSSRQGNRYLIVFQDYFSKVARSLRHQRPTSRNN